MEKKVEKKALVAILLLILAVLLLVVSLFFVLGFLGESVQDWNFFTRDDVIDNNTVNSESAGRPQVVTLDPSEDHSLLLVQWDRIGGLWQRDGYFYYAYVAGSDQVNIRRVHPDKLEVETVLGFSWTQEHLVEILAAYLIEENVVRLFLLDVCLKEAEARAHFMFVDINLEGSIQDHTAVFTLPVLDWAWAIAAYQAEFLPGGHAIIFHSVDWEGQTESLHKVLVDGTLVWETQVEYFGKMAITANNRLFYAGVNHIWELDMETGQIIREDVVENIVKIMSAGQSEDFDFFAVKWEGDQLVFHTYQAGNFTPLFSWDEALEYRFPTHNDRAVMLADGRIAVFYWDVGVGMKLLVH